MARATSLLFLFLSLFAAHTTSGASSRKIVGFYEIKKGDFSIKVTNWGATIVSVILPDSKGYLADVVLGYDGLGPYIKNPSYFGALVGRVANRISGGQFVLDGVRYKLPINDGNNTLHGGHRGFSYVIWTVKELIESGEFPYITLYYHSFDGEQGFPGALDVYVTYKISGPYQLSVSMQAKPLNKATPVNLVQHTYWNLGGHDSGTILSETVQIFGSEITPLDANLIPTGKFSPVAGTPYDLRKPAAVGSRIDEIPGGFNINYVLDSPPDARGLRKVARVRDGSSGRAMELWANQPGVQFFTPNFLQGVKGKGGHVYQQHDALCLETQGFADAVNHPNFPSQIVYPGHVYRHEMLFQFSFGVQGHAAANYTSSTVPLA